LHPNRQTAELVVGSGLTAVMTIGYIVYVGRAVGAAEYSDFSAALSAIYFVGLTFTPLTPTIARLTARYRARGTDGAVVALRSAALQRVTVWAGAVTLVGAAASVLLASMLQFRTPLPLVIAFAAILLFAIVSVDRGVVQGLLFFRLYNSNIAIEAAVRLFVAVALLLIKRTAAAALLGYAVALAVAELAMLPRLRHEWRNRQRESVDWSDVQRLAVPIMILMFALAVFQNTDMLAVKRWFSPRDAGAWGAGSAIARGIGVIFVPFYVMAGPLLTSLHEEGKAIFASTIRLTLTFIAAVIVPLVIIAIMPRFLLSVLYGADFVRGATIIAPLAGVAVITYTGLMLAQALVTLHEFRFLIGYVFFAIMQIAGLVLFHASYADILRVLYTTQIAALLSVSLFFVRAWRRR
jgi:O-antigen/teichoic acid export membrane protein